jgi:putative ABC transport system permease protein
MTLIRQLRRLFRKDQLDAEMAEEMRLHLEMQAERNRAAGMSPDEARFAAQREFGNVGMIQQQVREGRGWTFLDQCGANTRLALRSLVKNPGFTITSVITAALGIGASTAIFSVVHALVLSPLCYRDADQLVQLRSQHPEQGTADFAPATLGDLVDSTQSFAGLAAQYYYYVNLTGVDSPAQLNSADITRDYFAVFGVTPLRGRTCQAGDFKPGATPVVVLGHALWQSQFGGRESIVGDQILLDDVAYTVVGVMPPSFKDPSEVAQLWRPMRPDMDNLRDRRSRYWTIFGRLKPGTNLGRANAELATAGQQLADAFPADYNKWTIHATALRDQVVGDYRVSLLVVLGAVGSLTLIACANVAGLAIVRAIARRKELAIRTALGSSRQQLIGLLLAESVLVAVPGGAGGLLLAYWGVQGLLKSMPPGWLPRTDEVAVNVPVLAAALGLTILTAIVAGLLPGIAATRIDTNEAVKGSARGSAGPSAQRLRTALIVAEIALALSLLTGAGLLGRSFLGLLGRKSGVDATRVLSLNLSLSAKRYSGAEKCWDFFSRVQTEVAATPGVEAAAFTHTSPFRWGIPEVFAPVQSDLASRMPGFPPAFQDSVGVDYFKAMGILLRSGRLFNAADDPRTRPVIILSETAARRYFGSADPLGQFIAAAGAPTTRLEVVGIVGDVRRNGLATDVPMQVYRPFAQRTPPFATLMVRTALPPASLAKAVQAAIWRIDPDVPISDVGAMDTFVSRSIAGPRLYLLLFALFGGIALLLAAIGLYGLVRYSVEQRTREFGIRAALGAGPREVRALVLREGGKLIVLGLVIGLVVSLLAAGLLRSMVVGVSVYDPLVLAAGSAVLALAATMACLLPARRAAKVDPVVALRAE